MPEGTPTGTGVFEIMHTTRAMRRLKPDPVPDELIRKILLAGQAAASGGNTQRWRFLVLKDQKIKKAVQVYYKRAFDEVVGPRYASSSPPPGSDAARYKRQLAAVEYLTDHYHDPHRRLVVVISQVFDGGKLTFVAGGVRPRRCRTCCWRRVHSGS